MPVFDSRNLLVQLEKDVHEILNQVNTLKSDTSVQWNQQPAPGKWSPVQIIEHLNSYNRYYLHDLSSNLQWCNNLKIQLVITVASDNDGRIPTLSLVQVRFLQ